MTKGNGKGPSASRPRADLRTMVEIYRGHELLVRGADDNGHSMKVATNVPPTVKKILSKEVQKGVWIWETEADMVRYFVIEGIRRLGEMRPEPGYMEQVKLLNSMLEVTGREDEFLQFQRALERSVEAIDGLRRAGATDKAGDMLRELALSASRIQDAFWRGRFAEVLAAKQAELERGTQ